MANQEIFETIEAYLAGALTGTKLSDFEARLQSDSELAKQVSLFKEMDEAIADQSVLNFQKLVQSEGETYTQQKQASEAKVKSITWPRRYLAIAATVLILIVSTLFFWNNQPGNPLSGKELFAQNFETYALDQNLRSEETSVDDTFKSGIQQYQAKDFNAAATTFQHLAETADQDMVLAFCLANAYLNQIPPDFKLAEKQFQKIITNGESIYVPRAKWYMALILLERGETKDAEKILKEVALSSDKFGRNASELLEELKD